MSDDAAVGAHRGAHASESLSQMLRRLYPEAYECPELSEPPVPGAHASDSFHPALNLSRRVVLINLAAGKMWLGEWCGLVYQPVLFRTPDGRWFCARSTLDGYQTPPGCPRDVEFLELNDEQALFWFTKHKIDAPPDLIEAYKSSMARWVASQADQPAGTTNPPTAASTPRLGPQAPPDTEAAGPTPPVGNQPSKAPGAAADPEGATEPSDPLAETISKLKGCGRQVEIVRYLGGRLHDGFIPLEQVAIEVFKVREASLRSCEKTVRRQVERTRDNLVKKACPLRLDISANTLRLIPVPRPQGLADSNK